MFMQASGASRREVANVYSSLPLLAMTVDGDDPDLHVSL